MFKKFSPILIFQRGLLRCRLFIIRLLVFMNKRKRFILTSIILSFGFIIVQFLSEQYRYVSIGGLGFLTLVLFAWSIREGIGFNATLFSLVLPFFFTVGVGLFWFLLPSSIFAKIPIVILYGFGIYALCLTANIYTVATIRTIALLRAAKGVGFVLSLLTFFLIFDTVLSIHWSAHISSLVVFTASFPLFLQSYWSVNLEKFMSSEVLKLSLISSLVVGEIAIALFFWPVTVVVGSLFLTVTAYMLVGLGQSELEGRLFKQTTREYLLLGLLVFIGMFFATRWGG